MAKARHATLVAAHGGKAMAGAPLHSYGHKLSWPSYRTNHKRHACVVGRTQGPCAICGGGGTIDNSWC
eukprot:scaffold64773_cov25-Tisochrysis_lutea.AAC.3